MMYNTFTKWAFLISSVSALLCLLGVHDYAKTTLVGLVSATLNLPAIAIPIDLDHCRLSLHFQ